MSSSRDPEATYRPTPGGTPEALSALGLVTPALSILLHPDPVRVGQSALMPGLDAGESVEVSRLAPAFQGLGPARPLTDRALSRAPLTLVPMADGAIALRASAAARACVDGLDLNREQVLSRDRLGTGVLIELAQRVVLLLHLREPLSTSTTAITPLRGSSAAMERARQQIRAVAGVDVPVLVRGETGTGKELAARALHDMSVRGARAFVAVNMAAITPTLAAAELFGHARGAFSGALAHRDGLFVQADGGTLFLDEIGEAPLDVQVMLLRALETGVIQPVGASSTRKVDVRIVAATDASLEDALANGSFRAPLYHRLAGYEIIMPPLRDRIEDIGTLLMHFLTLELGTRGAPNRLPTPDPGTPMWLSCALMQRIVRCAWPGNVRQLRNVARQLAVTWHARPEIQLEPALERVLGGSRGLALSLVASDPEAPPALSEETVLAALEANDYRLARAAAQLGVARNTLNAFIDRSTTLRRPRDLEAVALVGVLEESRGDLALAARTLRISERGLKLRMRELGLGDSR